MMKQSIYNMTKPDLEQWLLDHGEKPSRAQLIWKGLYQDLVDDFSDISGIRDELAQRLSSELMCTPLEVTEMQEGTGTVKFLFCLEEGSLIETVLMHHGYGSSVCVTTQVGCNMGCRFCASGLLTKQRDLTAGEITAQVLHVMRFLKERDEEHKVTHITVMGIGEPFDNYENLMCFLEIITDQKGLSIAPRRITVSTSGLAPKIIRFAGEKIPVQLAISLHAPNDRIRSGLMRVNDAYPTTELILAVSEYIHKTNRRVFFEYIMIRGINDQPDHALELAKLLSPMGKKAYVNLIPYNPVEENSFQRSERDSISLFFDLLMKNGVTCIIRRELGTEIDGACGQLRSRHVIGGV